MNKNFLKFLTIFLPSVFFVSLIILRSSLVSSPISWGAETLIILIGLVGIIGFSTWVFKAIEKNEEEIKAQSEQLAALHEANLSLTQELDLGLVLQKVVDLARELSDAKYGALAVLDENGQINQFIPSGISYEHRAGMGATPQGKGLLGAVIEEGRPVRAANIREDERFAGFPAKHPIMQSFLGVPIEYQKDVIGELYLADKLNSVNQTIGFSDQDQRILEMFATQAAIAIKNAQLYRQSQQLSVLQERERFGMDLHDGIIQSIYAIGLMLEGTHHTLSEDLEQSQVGINHAILGLNEVIKDIRNYILDLRPNRFQGRDLKEGLKELARELRANSFLDVNLELNETDVSAFTPEKTVEILHIAQEGLSNIRKHARATSVDILLREKNTCIILSILDDGIGINSESVEKSPGNGLRNMRERVKP
ncbi:MAG: GAF domain-containing protein [Anaerolineae bacterium]|nr:GAF domain-containing protein [Anaerolineae bacterium]